MNESPIVLACEDVTLGYEHKPLLEHLTLTVRAGDEVLLELPLQAEQAVEKLSWGGMLTRLLRCAFLAG